MMNCNRTFRNFARFHALAAFLASLHIYCAKPAFSDDKTLAEFRQYYPSALQRLKSSYTHVHAQYNLRSFGTSNPSAADRAAKAATSVYEFEIQGDKKRILQKWFPEIDGKNELKREYALIINDGGLLDLKHDAGGSENFVVVKMMKQSDVKNVSSDEQREGDFLNRGGKYLLAGFMCETIDMKYIIDPEYATVSSAESLIKDGQRVVRIDFRTNSETRPRYDGTIELLPDIMWAISNYKFSIYAKITPPGSTTAGLMKSTSTATIRYLRDHDVPVPMEIIYTSDNKTNIVTNDSISFDPPPSQKFGLGHYGLPDVTAPPVSSSRLPTSYLLLGAAFLALAIFLVLRRHRNSTNF